MHRKPRRRPIQADPHPVRAVKLSRIAPAVPLCADCLQVAVQAPDGRYRHTTEPMFEFVTA